MNQKKFDIHFINSNGIKIRYGVAGDLKAASHVLFFVNGRAEWIEKYEHLLTEWPLPENTCLVTFDERGQGASEGEKAWVATYEDYARDLKNLVEHVAGSKTYAFVCHSMGGLITLSAYLRKWIDPKTIVLSSPLLRLNIPKIPPWFAKPLSFLLAGTFFSHTHTSGGKYEAADFDENLLTQSREQFDKLCNTPYPIPGASFGWVKATYEASDIIFDAELLQNIKCPILVLGGALEKVVDASAFTDWAELARKQSEKNGRNLAFNYQLIPDAKHELLNEKKPVREQTHKVIFDWLNRYFF